MTKSQFFLFLNLAFLGSVAVRSFVAQPIFFIIAFFIFLLVLWLVGSRKVESFPVKSFFLIGLLVVGALGVWRYTTIREEKLTSLELFRDQNIEVRGYVVSPPELLPQSQRLKVEVQEIKGRKEKVAAEVLVLLRKFPEYAYGDEVLVRGKLRPLLRGSELAGWIMSFPQVDKVKGSATTLRYILFSVKQKYLRGLNEALREPYAALARGLLVGDDSGFGQDLKESFRNSGLSHVVALSGYNITIVASSLTKFLQFLSASTGLAFWASTAGITIFTIATGAQASTVRAAIMGLLVLIAERQGRLYSMTNALAFAGSMMVLADPAVLKFNVGFQLSFLSTLGLIYVAPRLEPYFQWITRSLNLRGIIVATLSSQFVVLPLLLGYFGQISLLGIFANILVIPLVPLTMALSFVSGLGGVFFGPISRVLGWISEIFLGWEIYVAKFFTSLGFTILHFSPQKVIAIVLGLIYYILLAWFIFSKKQEGVSS